MFEYVAKVVRTTLPQVDDDEVATMVTLELVRDADVVQLHDGDEFVTVTLAVDPFAPA